MSGENLDRLCARYGYQIATEVYAAMNKTASATENHITKSLGVLQEDGLYAFALYQASRGREKNGSQTLADIAKNLLGEVGIPPFDACPSPDLLEGLRGDSKNKFKGLTESLDALLLAKRLLEQTLIYARYHAKALEP
jgi:hypothetical protein